MNPTTQFLLNWISPFLAIILTASVTYIVKRSENRTKRHINELQEQHKKSIAQANENASIIYREIHKLVHSLGASTVFIIVPHPRVKSHLLSAVFPVTRNGVEDILRNPNAQNVSMNEAVNLTNMLRDEEFWYRTAETATDRTAQSVMLTMGLNEAYGHKIVDIDGHWVGAVVACNVDKSITEYEIKEKLRIASRIIAPILPEIPNK